jgi:hypothetical protein
MSTIISFKCWQSIVMVRLPDVTSTKVIVPTVLFAFLSPAVTGMGGLTDRLGMTSVFGILYIIILRGVMKYVVRPSEVYLASAMYFLLSGITTTQELIIRNAFLYWILFAVIRSQSPLEF